MHGTLFSIGIVKSSYHLSPLPLFSIPIFQAKSGCLKLQMPLWARHVRHRLLEVKGVEDEKEDK